MCMLLTGVLSAEPSDSTSVLLAFLPISMGEYERLVDSVFIRTQEEYYSLITTLKGKHSWVDEEPLEIDFDVFSLVCDESWADCVASFSYEVIKDTFSKKVLITVTEHYGGGRGMCDFHHWFLIQRISEDYTVKFIYAEGEPIYPYGN